MIDQAVFIVGGHSSRFEGIVSHKSLLKICEQTLIERQIIQSANLGVRRFIFVLGHVWQKVESRIAGTFDVYHIPFDEFTIILNRDYETTKTGYALWLSRHYLVGGPTLVWEGDIAVRNFPVLAGGRNVWFVIGGPCDENGSYIRQHEQGVFDESPGPDWAKSAGVFHIETWPAFFDNNKDKLIDEIFIESPFDIFVINYDDWQEIDTIEDFRCAKEKFKELVRFQPDPATL